MLGGYLAWVIQWIGALPMTLNSSFGPVGSLFQRPFLFLRHGESTTNRAGVIAGWRDPELTDLGCEQARRAAEILKDLPLTAIFSSPLQRAWDTAAPIAKVLDMPVHAVDGLKERNWGALEGRPLAERPHMYIDPEGGETWDDFGTRVWTTLEGLEPYPGLPLIVAHSGVMRVIRHRLGLSARAERVANGVPIRLEPPDRSGTHWTETPYAQRR
ncbi:histidine phosphatase family protein [Rhodospirillum sp. A1_3_36]|uniref:histidine phosphatase family protein n=1 Tax=Rhodospirillum sp. A1_3_36 TaxID=3391666 RepID=UPI0039A555FF